MTTSVNSVTMQLVLPIICATCQDVAIVTLILVGLDRRHKLGLTSNLLCLQAFNIDKLLPLCVVPLLLKTIGSVHYFSFW